MPERILIADDDQTIRNLLELVLSDQGYVVLSAHNGDTLVRMAQEHVPDLILVDLMMPIIDGYEAIRQLRNDTRTAHIAMLILTARSSPNDIVTGFETGADDYIIKPFNIPELLARVKGHLRRAAQQPVKNPLTGLAGNILITEEVKYRLARGEPFAYVYVDLDNFKSFNDTYGPARGDRVIQLVADILVEVVAQHGTGKDFIGHIGGDDFVVLTTPDVLDILCPAIMAAFDERVRDLYDPEDVARGYLQGIDRQGVRRHFPIVSISLGVVTNRQRQFADHDEVSRVAADMKQVAKHHSGSAYAVDVRAASETEVEQERRGQRLAGVLLISVSYELRAAMGAALDQAGYRSFEAPTIPAAHALLARTPDLGLVVADALFGDPLWELVDAIYNSPAAVPLVVLSTHPHEEQRAAKDGVCAYLRQPFQMPQFIACVAQFARRVS